MDEFEYAVNSVFYALFVNVYNDFTHGSIIHYLKEHYNLSTSHRSFIKFTYENELLGQPLEQIVALYKLSKE